MLCLSMRSHAVIYVAEDIVLDGFAAVDLGRIAPVNEINVDTLADQLADEAPVGLEVHHFPAVDEGVEISAGVLAKALFSRSKWYN